MLSGHRGSQGVAKRLFWIEAWVEALVWSFEEVHQKHHLPIFHLPDSHFDFRDFASTDVPSGPLEFSRQLRLRPAAIAPYAPHLPTDDILMIHAARKDSKIAPTRCAAAKMTLLRCALATIVDCGTAYFARPIRADGHREVLGFDVGDSEDGEFWTAFLRSLKARGWAGCSW